MERLPTTARRRQIADAALAVIAEGGLARFTSVAIARRIGVSDGALFRHFESKDEIVLAAIDRVEELLFGDPPPDHADPVERLRAFFDRRLALMRENPGVSRLVTSDQLAQAAPPEGVARIAALKRRSFAFVRTCLDDAAASGALAPGVGPYEAAVIVVGSLYALAHGGHAVRGEPADSPARVWRALEIFLRGGAARAAERRPRAAAGVRTRAKRPRRPRGTRR
jgi:AcrR family transcriptional regulator